MAPRKKGRKPRKTTFQGFALAEPGSAEEEEAEASNVQKDQDSFNGGLRVSQYGSAVAALSSGSSTSSSDHLGVEDEEQEEEEDEGGELEEDEAEDVLVVRNGSFLHHSNSSFSMRNAFAPPFYNRPPTPLPPSPSLTSLLRPPFSTTTSRPSTPDSSDNDTPNDTESAVTRSARIATTVPRASPKVPTYEYYGFVLYLLSSLAFCEFFLLFKSQHGLLNDPVVYLLWSYLPSPFLHQLGIYYYPNRWWSLAIPSFLVMTIVYIYVALASYNTNYLTPPMDSVENIVDSVAHVAVVDSRGHLRRKGDMARSLVDLSDASKAEWRSLWNEGTDAVMDIPVGGVCEILYG